MNIAAEPERGAEIPWQASQAIESWQRILNATKGDKASNFKRACVELLRLASVETEPLPLSQIVDVLYEMAKAAGFDDDQTQALMAEATRAPPDLRPINGTLHQSATTRDGDEPIYEPPLPNGPADYGLSPDAEKIDEEKNEEPPPPPPELAFLDAANWQGLAVPTRRWLVAHRIPLANVTMLNGDGAAGKTTIALQLAIATVRGTDWLGSVIDEPGSVIFSTAEEDADEIHRRAAAIVQHHGIAFRDLSGLHVLCRPDADSVLGAPNRAGVIQPTQLFASLSAAAETIRPKLIVIEAAADVFAGNENDRAQVRQFIALLRRLSLSTGAAILLIAHPSLSGLASGSGTSGSTAWSNSVRSRLYFTSARKTDDDESDVRELKVMKANYGPSGEVVRLRWQAGVFVPEGGPGMLERVAAEAAVDQAYLDCLDASQGSGRHVGPYTGKAYAPAIFEKMPQTKGYRAKALASAQERLFGAGRIEVRKVGPPSKALDRIFRKAAP